MKKKWIQRGLAFLCAAVMLLCSGPAASVNVFAAGAAEQASAESTQEESDLADLEGADVDEYSAAEATTASTEESASEIGGVTPEPGTASEPKAVTAEENTVPDETEEAAEQAATNESDESGKTAAGDSDETKESALENEAEDTADDLSSLSSSLSPVAKNLPRKAGAAGPAWNADNLNEVYCFYTVRCETDSSHNQTIYPKNLSSDEYTVIGPESTTGFWGPAWKFTIKLTNPEKTFPGHTAGTGSPTLLTLKVDSGGSVRSTIDGVYYIQDIYTIDWDANGGTVDTTGATTQAVKGSTITPPADPVKNEDEDWYYTFDGWYTETEGGTKLTDYGTVKDNQTFHAHWVQGQSRTITYNTNGGSEIANDTYVEGRGKTLPTSTEKNGYAFAGWYDNEGLTGDPITAISPTDRGDQTFYAKWNKLYGITYHLYGETTESGTYAEGVGLTTLPAPTRDGYQFDDWYDNADLTGDAVTAISATDTGDKTLYAKWVKSYKITYNVNGGTAIADDTYAEGRGKTLPTSAVRDGYAFAGWYDNEGFTGDPVTAVSTTDTGDKTFYAKWTANTYTVKFEANGGKGTMADQTFTYGEAQNLRKNTFTRAGYNFNGWVEDTGATTPGLISPGPAWVEEPRTFTDEQSVLNLTTDQNGTVILKAQWTAVRVENQLNAAGGTAGYTGENFNNLTDGNLTTKWCTGTAGNSMYVVIDAGNLNNGDPIILKQYALTTGNDNETNPGRNPKNWIIYGSDSQSGPWTEITRVTDDNILQDQNHETYSFNVNDNTAPYRYYKLEITATKSANVMQLSELQFTQYSTDYYTVTFNANEGTGDVPSEIYAEKGSKITIPSANLSKTGYTFAGWNTKADGTGTTYKAGSTATPATGTETAVTLYALWTPNTYKVHFEANGATGTMADQTFTYDAAAKSLSKNSFTKEGYVFTGWNGSDGNTYDDGQSVQNLTAVNNDTFTMTAQWRPAKYTVKFDLNGGTGTVPPDINTEYDAEVTMPSGSGLTKANYTFAGWNTARDGTGTNYIVGDTGEDPYKNLAKVDNDIVTLYANWSQNVHKITYSFTDTAPSGATVPGQEDGSAGDNVKLTDPKPVTGYKFNGWSADDTTVSIGTDGTFTMPDRAVTFTGSWTPVTYTISCDLDGGKLKDGESNPTSYTIESAEVTIDKSPVRTGYTFAGWTGTELDEAAKTVTIPTGSYGDRTYKATWTPNTDTKYVVNHYVKGLGEDTYTLSGTEEKAGTTASSLTLKDLAKDITGFTYAEGFAGEEASGTTASGTTASGTTAAGATKPDNPVTSTTILADGTRVINLYYTRNIHTVTLKAGRGIASVTGGGNYEYGAQVTYGVTLKPGYDWTGAEGTGWTGTNTSTDQQYSYTMPDKDVTDTANAEAHAYAISYDLDGGSLKEGESNPESYTIESDTFTLKNPVKAGYAFAGWVEVNSAGGTAGTPAASLQIEKGSTGNKSYKAVWKDITAPTGMIQLGSDHSYTSLTSDLHFDLHFKSVRASVTASDNSGGSVAIEYLTSDKKLTATGLEQEKFSAYSDPLQFDQAGNYILYVRLTDPSGNVSYLSTDGFVIEKALPSVKDIAEVGAEEKTEEYIGTQVFTIGETDDIESITVDGSPADYESGELTLNPSNKDQVVVITNKSGKTTTITVAVHPVRMIEGMGQSVTVGSKEALKFRSNADFGEDGSNFDHVEVDGKTLDPANYKAWSGSTYAELTGEYVSSLPVGEHTIAIVSKNGTADTTFTVTEAKQSVDPNSGTKTTSDDQKDSKDKSSETESNNDAKDSGGQNSSKTNTSGTQNSSNTNSSHSSSAAETGDSSHVVMYAALLAGACAVLVLLAVVGRRRRRHE